MRHSQWLPKECLATAYRLAAYAASHLILSEPPASPCLLGPVCRACSNYDPWTRNSNRYLTRAIVPLLICRVIAQKVLVPEFFGYSSQRRLQVAKSIGALHDPAGHVSELLKILVRAPIGAIDLSSALLQFGLHSRGAIRTQ